MDTTVNVTGTYHNGTDYEWKFTFAGRFRTTFAIITIIVGCIGNVLSFLIMRGRSMRSTSAGVYFAAIAIADTGTLLTGQIPAVVYYLNNFDIPSSHEWACKWFFFLLFSLGDVAVWLMVAVTVDRFIAVCLPLKRKVLCTPTRALASCLGLAGTAVVKNLHLFWTRGAQDVEQPDGTLVTIQCGWPRADYEYFGKYIRPWIAFSLYAFIPIASLIVLNSAIAVALWRFSKVKPGMASSTGGPENSGQQRKAAAERRKTIQLTWMLLTVSVSFLVLVIPSITVLVAKPYVARTSEQLASYAIVEAIADTLVYINHSSNFFLYCLSGPGFRKEAKLLLCRGWFKNQVSAVTSLQDNSGSMTYS